MTSGVERTPSGAIPAVNANERNWSVSVIGFGPPSDPRTFSGYSRNLVRAIARAGALRREFSARQVGPLDAFRGAISLTPQWPLPRLRVSRAWMWSRRGNDTISRRLNRSVWLSGDRGAFLEVGTLIRLDSSLGRHYQLTDMTVAQARRAGRFAVGGLSATRLREAEALQSEILGEVAHVFALSEWTADSLVGDCGVPKEKISVVYAGSNLQIAEGEKAVRRPMEILFVGIDWNRKGGPLLLDAFREVRRVLPDATLRIVGCEPRQAGPGVIVEGLLDRRDPRQYERLCRAYLEAAVFCLPSHFDPFPNAIVEAMGVGLPAVAFDNGSRREAIVDGSTGRLVEPGDVGALSRALIEVLRDTRARDTMSANARARVNAHFTWERVVERIGVAVRGDGVAVHD